MTLKFLMSCSLRLKVSDFLENCAFAVFLEGPVFDFGGLLLSLTILNSPLYFCG